MRLAAVFVAFSLGVSCAQDHKQKVAQAGQPGNPGPARSTAPGKGKKRLESVTWDLKSHKLVWVVETGEAKPNGEFLVKTSDRYEISPEDATMAVRSEKRGFTEREAASLLRLLDTLSLYCVESVVWWDRGEGDPINGDGQRVRKPEPPPRTPAPHGPVKPSGPTIRTMNGLEQLAALLPAGR